MGPKELGDNPLIRLRETITRSGALTHAKFLAYLALLIYFFVAVTSTTHEDLLRETPKAVPLLNIQLPLWWFFLAGPIALAIIHLNLLIQYYYLAQNLSRYDQAIAKAHGSADSKRSREERTMTANFVLVNLHLDRDMPGLLRSLMHVALWSFTAVAPLILLLLFQFYFLPYHSEFVTWVQRGTFVFCACMLLYLWPRIISGKVQRPSFRRLDTIALGIIAGLGFISSFFFLTIPDEPLDIIWPHLRSKMSPEYQAAPDWRSLNLSGKLLLKAVPSAELLAKYSMNLNDLEPTLIKLIGQQKLGLDLRGRDLRYAHFANSKLYHASLREAEMEGINLEDARMQGADFKQANLQNAYLHQTELAHANFSFANLQGADMIGAKLQGADLIECNLHGSNLSMANLLGANLFYAKLHGADLSATILRGAILTEAELKGANLSDADLQGANLEGATIESSLALRANLQSATFLPKILKTSDFRFANFRPLPDNDYNELNTSIDKLEPRFNNGRGGEFRIKPTILYFLHIPQKTIIGDQPKPNDNICVNQDITETWNDLSLSCDESMIERIYRAYGRELKLTACSNEAAAENISTHLVIGSKPDTYCLITANAFLDTPCPSGQTVDERYLYFIRILYNLSNAPMGTPVH